VSNFTLSWGKKGVKSECGLIFYHHIYASIVYCIGRVMTTFNYGITNHIISRILKTYLGLVSKTHNSTIYILSEMFKVVNYRMSQVSEFCNIMMGLYLKHVEYLINSHELMWKLSSFIQLVT